GWRYPWRQETNDVDCTPSVKTLAASLGGGAQSAAPVSPSRRDHVPNSAARIRMIPAVSRDQVPMGVPDRLSGGGAVVDADVEAVRMELGDDLGAFLPEQRVTGQYLLVLEVEEALAVPLWDHQGVPLGR